MFLKAVFCVIVSWTPCKNGQWYQLKLNFYDEKTVKELERVLTH